MFPVTITIHDSTQLQAVLAAMGEEPISVVEIKEPPKQQAQTTSAKKADKPAPTKPTAEEAKADAQESKEGSSEQAQSPATYEDAKAIALKLSATKGRDALVAVLGKFEAAKLGDIPAEKFAEFVVAAQEALEAE